MGHHVAPADLAPDLQMGETELVSFCLTESIPILHGRVDRTLVEAQLAANEAAERQRQDSATA